MTGSRRGKLTLQARFEGILERVRDHRGERTEGAAAQV